MKNLLILFFVIIGLTLFAQQEAPPQGINYQAVVYSDNGNNQPGLNSPGQVLWNEDIGVQFSILSGSASGTVIYKETHATSTDEFGMFNLVIGQGLVQGTQSFNMIDWGSGYHFLKVEVDKTGGTDYVEMSNQQLWSVPYALYSGYSSSSGYADSSAYADIAGNGLTGVTDNGDGTLTFTYYDGSTYTTAILSGLGGVGQQGPAGADGQDGLSAYEIWLSQGNTGTEQDFLNSLEGPQGPAGTNGADGINGIDGTNGIDGQDGQSAYEIWLSQGNTGTEQDFLNSLEGPQGATGPQGVTGLQGPAGNDGASGAQGPQGVSGPQGIAGPAGTDGNGIASTIDNGDGTFTFVFDDGTTYTSADLTGPQGATGSQGLTGPQGATGSQGPQGVAGPTGPQGATGADGNGIASTSDNGDGTFTFTYDDGTTFTTSDLTGPEGAADNDSDSTNEIQSLSIINDSLFLSNSNGISLSELSNGNVTSKTSIYSFTMISSQSVNYYFYSDACSYCDSLSEGGFTDWVLPSLEEWSYLSTGGATNNYSRLGTWLMLRTPNFNSGSNYRRLWGNTLGDLYWPGTSSSCTTPGSHNNCPQYVRCIR